jgi:hypothetical protein
MAKFLPFYPLDPNTTLEKKYWNIIFFDKNEITKNVQKYKIKQIKFKRKY